MFRSKPEPEPVLGIAYEEALSVHLHDLEDLEDVGGIMSTRKNVAVKTLLTVLNEKFFNTMLNELANNVRDHSNSLEERYRRLQIEVRTDGSDSRVKKAKKDRKKLEKLYMKSQNDLKKNLSDLAMVQARLEQFHSNFGGYNADIGALRKRAEGADNLYGKH